MQNENNKTVQDPREAVILSQFAWDPANKLDEASITACEMFDVIAPYMTRMTSYMLWSGNFDDVDDGNMFDELVIEPIVRRLKLGNNWYHKLNGVMKSVRTYHHDDWMKILWEVGGYQTSPSEMFHDVRLTGASMCMNHLVKTYGEEGACNPIRKTLHHIMVGADVMHCHYGDKVLKALFTSDPIAEITKLYESESHETNKCCTEQQEEQPI